MVTRSVKHLSYRRIRCFLAIDNSPTRDGLLIESFNGKPQATELENAGACGLPLNENAQTCTQSTRRNATGYHSDC
ncbi:hypothetical protein Pla100_15670 [Neorhodopirellula pilleata]|uniref:Uncharacterized protein n=1 Tax=Neorhodopirellula pilleata TaxID=2714738 RepID=A0A5C6AQT7_9BACT|nr:hypothetical protein Pla100_15670 [Neorhodopirellula pilleata]